MAAIPQAALAARPGGVYTRAMKIAADRVLLFSSIGHGLMHLMTAFYAVIVLTLAAVWHLPVETLLELYAPATVLLGIMSLPAGWASDRFGAPVMMVVMFAGMGLSSIACGLVPTGDTLALSSALCGIGSFAAIYHSVGIGWVIRTAKEQSHLRHSQYRGHCHRGEVPAPPKRANQAERVVVPTAPGLPPMHQLGLRRGLVLPGR